MRRPTIAALALSSLFAVAGCGHDGHPEADGQTSEMMAVNLSEAPAPVQAAIRRDYPGATVTYIGKHEMGDHSHYHVELTTADGKTVYHTYSPAGTDMSDPH